MCKENRRQENSREEHEKTKWPSNVQWTALHYSNGQSSRNKIPAEKSRKCWQIRTALPSQRITSRIRSSCATTKISWQVWQIWLFFKDNRQRVFDCKIDVDTAEIEPSFFPPPNEPSIFFCHLKFPECIVGTCTTNCACMCLYVLQRCLYVWPCLQKRRSAEKNGDGPSPSIGYQQSSSSSVEL